MDDYNMYYKYCIFEKKFLCIFFCMYRIDDTQSLTHIMECFSQANCLAKNLHSTCFMHTE